MEYDVSNSEISPSGPMRPVIGDVGHFVGWEIGFS